MTRPPPSSPLFPSATLSRPPTSARPASNCGLTRTTACQPGAHRPRTGGSARRTEMKETSQTASRGANGSSRSEEHTSELQSQSNIVCRLLLEKKKKIHQITPLLIQLALPFGTLLYIVISSTYSHYSLIHLDYLLCVYYETQAMRSRPLRHSCL